jgi:phosphoglycerate kinase
MYVEASVANAEICSHKVMQDSDIQLAKELVEEDKVGHKIVELPFLVESDTLEARIEGKYRTIGIKVCTYQ